MIRTPIPQSVVDWLGDIRSGSNAVTLWRAVLLVGILMLVYALATLGVVGVVIAFAILSTLITDRVQEFVSDLWNGNFWEV